MTYLYNFSWKFGLAFAINYSEVLAPFALKVSKDDCIG